MNIPFLFNSADHIRYENGVVVSGPHGGAPRAIKVESNISGGKGFTVTIYNTDEQYVVQMTPKQMEIIKQDRNQIILRGFGSDFFGGSFTDYGLTINYIDDEIDNCILHLLDRNVDIKYLKSEIDIDEEISPALMLNFENASRYLQDFIRIPQNVRIETATKTDELNNIGVDYYEDDDIANAIKFFNKALDIFSLNDDALKNLIVCYRAKYDFEKMQKAQNVLEIVRRLGL